MLKVSLLQTPTVELDGHLLTFPYRRVEALLYYMLVQRSATRQELIALLWEGLDEATALRNLRNTLYALKKVLGKDFLTSPQKSLVMVNPDREYTCDYDSFVLAGEIAVYRGPFLKGFAVKHAFCYEEWVSRTRDHLRDRYLRRLAQQAQTALETQGPEPAAQWAEEYLREEPLDEHMVTFLMTRWRETRQYARAAQLFQRLKTQLSDELGADPQEDTTAQYYEIMNEWSGTATPVSPIKSPGLVGREVVYTALCTAAEAFATGTARRCSQLLIGEFGSGKSQLISQFLQTCDLSTLFVLNFACLQPEKDMPLAPWSRIMFPLSDLIRTEDVPVPAPVRARLGQAFSAFRESSEADATPPALIRQPDQSLEDCLVIAIGAAARRRRILLVLEDIEWIDPDSLALIDTLLRRLDSGLMLVLTCRTSCSPSHKAVLGRAVADSLLQKQQLPPLNREQTRLLLAEELGEETAKTLADRVFRETGGNLYLLTELTQAYRRNGGATQTPGTLDEILLERLSASDDDAMHIAELISLFPEEAPWRILLALLGGDDYCAVGGMEALMSRGLIEEYLDSGEVYYRFSHRRIRELIYERMTFLQRRPLHLQIAELLTQNGPPRQSSACRRTSRHFKLAGDNVRALEYRLRALEIESAYSCEPFPLLVGNERPFASPEALAQEALQAAQELSALQAENATAARPLSWMLTLIRGRIALFCGNLKEGATLLGTLSAAGSEEPAHAAMIRACYLLASSALCLQAVNQAEHYTDTGIRLLTRYNDPVMTAQFQRLRGDCFCLRGAYDKSSYYLLEALEELERLPSVSENRLLLAAANYDYGQLCRQRRDYAGACSHFKKALSMLGNEPWPGTLWIYVHYGRTAFAMEDHFKAKELFKQGYALSDKTGELWGRTAAAAFCAYYLLRDGDYEAATHCLSDAQHSAQSLPSPLEGAILCFVSMRIRLRLDKESGYISALSKLLPMSAESYARQGIRKLSDIPDVFETELLSTGLRDGIAAQQNIRASELYSKNRHFMAE
ncbi:AAA family ATPase [Oscillospiraceae bacterium LTW-04]|nr:AAA family ATPase [Oscillospiraceae bacterium MB24-C1]